MKTYQIKFRISTWDLSQVLESLGNVGPVVVELIDDGKEVLGKVSQEVVVNTKPKKEIYRGYKSGRQIILDALQDGPVSTRVLRVKYDKAGLSVKGLGAALAKTQVAGLIQRTTKGWWELTEKKEEV